MSLLIDKIKLIASQFPDKIAIIDENGKYSYSSLMLMVESKVSFLKENNIKSLALKNLKPLDWIITDLACLQEGVLTLPIPDFFTQEQTDNAIEKSGVEYILDNQELIKISNSNSKIPDKTQKITFTSGSTGNPKGVCLSIENMENIVLSLDDYLKDENIVNHASLLPYAILLENIAGLYLTLYRAGGINCSTLTSLTGQELYNKLNNSNAESTILVPELLKMLLVYMQSANKTLANIKFIAVGGARVSEELLKQAETLKLPVFQGYGLSENSSVVALNNSSENKLGSVGKILPHVKYHFAEDGELIIDNPQFLGYSEASNKITSYPTGDITKIDDDGYLYITGRKKNIIITSMGRNVSPEWPESIILENKNIIQTIVYGDAESELKALITTDKAFSAEEIKSLKSYVNSKLPKYAQLAEIKRVENFAINNLLTGNMRPKRQQILKFYNLL